MAAAAAAAATGNLGEKLRNGTPKRLISKTGNFELLWVVMDLYIVVYNDP